MTALEELRALVHARTVLDRQIEEVAVRAVTENLSRTAIAYAMGISRAQLYRTVVKQGSQLKGQSHEAMQELRQIDSVG